MEQEGLELEGLELEPSVGWGGMLGLSWQDSQNTRQFSICCVCTGIGSKQICACALQEWIFSFLQPSGKLHWFSKLLRELVSLVLNNRAGVPDMGSKPLVP